MDPLPARSQSNNNAASGRWRSNPRRDYPPKHEGKTQPNVHPVFNWKDGVVPGTEPNYLRRAIDVDKALKQVTGPFGFDLECKPTFIKGRAESPVAMLQLAKEDQIYLIQLSAMHDFPERLREILEDRNIVKAGVGIAGDAKKLWRDCGVSLLGAVELGHFAHSADGLRWGTGNNLIS
ncbi:hypothetical protein FRC10_004034 [Ceratobasidium sp. 414]|nr:hypothetical protein FRC10_004034 [Ceratobasidium sp. 414]